MRLGIFAVAVALLLSACEATGPIDASESMLAVNLADGDGPAITREVTKVGNIREELWDWPSGTLRLVRAGRGNFFSEDFSEPEELNRSMGSWPASVRSTVLWEWVRTGKNVIGDFQYATVEKPNRVCFYMVQGIPFSRLPRFRPVDTPESSSGLIAFYQCASKNEMTLAEMESQGLELAEALARNW